MKRAAGIALAAVALLAAGCGSDGDDERSGTTRTVERTRVEVVGSGDGGGFDARAIYRRVAPGVVTVISVFEGRGGIESLLGGDGTQAGQGSGFVVGDDGEVVTNAHVVTTGEGQRIRKAQQVFVKFPDGNQVPARVIGFDPNSDVALLRLTEEEEEVTLRPLSLGNSRDVKVGAPVVAIGSPFGEENSLSVGVVSATGRAIDSLTGFDTLGAVQTDAAINQGNSGGPLIDADGRVIGINAQIRTRSGGGEGVGYAIPVDQVRRSLEQLREDGRVDYAYLGVATSPVYPQLNERFDLGTDTGAWVQEVVDGGPAEEAGIRAGRGEQRFQARPYSPGGDVIVRIEKIPVRTENDLGIAVARFRPGQRIELELLRDGERRKVTVRLGRRPAEAEESP